MPLQPVVRRSVPDQVYEQMLGEMVGGQIGAGGALPE